jgi:phosphoribosyl 1,2-cyclic phosphodiesterase
MPLFVSSLNSGSNGNCYYIGNGHDAVLIDVGLSCREMERRMRQVGLHMHTVKAIFISHEHTDHIRGLEMISKRYRLPIYITPGTLSGTRMPIMMDLVKSFEAGQGVSIGQLTVTSFNKPHDAVDPHSFIVSYEGIVVGVFTDIGNPHEQLMDHFKLCHAAFLESNYDEEMLEKGSYPIHLKRRIRGGEGHLSNKQALDVFLSSRPPHMTHLWLSHLSQDNNDPGLVLDLFSQYGAGMHIAVASRHEPGPVYTIDHNGSPVQRQQPLKQASLF